MLSALNLINDYQPVQPVRTRQSASMYRSRLALRQFVTAPIFSDGLEWMVMFKHGTTDTLEESLLEDVMDVPARVSITQRWQRFVLDPRASVDVDDLSETVDALYEAIGTFGPSVVSFEHLESNSVQGEHLAAALRATSPWRDEVAGWHTALQTARVALVNSGVAPEDALYGLIDF
ncbi:Uncharacterised protein [Burkholderia pseudomallei]|uniref:hypothetical protein n=1 Tax=Burkholderia pseudomallei TaxID=28450 RepID=UPI00016ABC6C|nr:hypothetical protein [Burkholderia pseudomallei]MBF3430693.1 hypothetical protein [Burkholderia pseudomallei]MBF3481111.1 hypothetical protein [Burkholderia pseudomallei]MBF3726997.1 hypothetical protein [Burkholderia pseudomallei]MBF3731560.1 hypothetical protein [Burkholderia pseudomallei]MBF3849594.1 hypothetical protein [Burkholderia pseudomallei]